MVIVIHVTHLVLLVHNSIAHLSRIIATNMFLVVPMSTEEIGGIDIVILWSGRIKDNRNSHNLYISQIITHRKCG